MNKIPNKLIALRMFLSEAIKRKNLRRSSNKKQNIGYIGGHGVDNLGDDVMYYALRKHLPGFNILTFQTVGVEKALAKFNLSGNHYFEKLVLGGGTLINDVWLDKVRRSLDLNIPIFALGTGVGSCGIEQETKVQFQNWNAVLEVFQYVGVRGELSKKRLLEIGVNSDISGDLALLLAEDKISYNTEKRIVLNLMDIPEYNVYWEKYIPEFKAMIEKGWIIQPMVINPIDLEYTRSYFKKLGLYDPIHTTLNYDKFRSQITGAQFSVNVRLHASVLSLCTNTPSILLGYRDKCHDFMQSLNLLDYYIAVEDELNNNEFSLNDKINSLKSVESNNILREKIAKETSVYKDKLLIVLNKIF